MTCKPCAVIGAYLYNLARWVDQGANALAGGDPRQTLSGRLGRAEFSGVDWAAAACRVIGFFWRDPKHCLGAIRKDDGSFEVLDIDGPRDEYPDLATATGGAPSEKQD
jgi:hypothetical protein